MSVTIQGSGGVTTNSGAVYDGIQRDTAVTASGTSVDFTDIPSWVKRITVMFSGISTNGSSSYLIQLGDSGGIENTGYLGSSASGNFTTGFGISSGGAANVYHGAITILNLTNNNWVATGTYGNSSAGASFEIGMSKTLSDILTQIRITTVNGTDTFDAGSINIIYE
jgi:hypothetical protein